MPFSWLSWFIDLLLTGADPLSASVPREAAGFAPDAREESENPAGPEFLEEVVVCPKSFSRPCGCGRFSPKMRGLEADGVGHLARRSLLTRRNARLAVSPYN